MDGELIAQFKIEADELLAEAEESLLLLEKGSDFINCYNQIFRCFHSLKGTSGMFGLDELQSHYHYLENFYESHKGSEVISSEKIDFFLMALDETRKYLAGETFDFQKFEGENDAMDTPGPKAELSGQNKDVVNDVENSSSNIVSLDCTKDEVGETIFIVDDEPEIVKSLTDMLSAEAYLVEGFTSPADLLLRVGEKKPHLVISDIKMPEMNGVELMQEINKIYPFLPTIIISGFFTKESCLKLLGLGINGIIEKPFDFDNLVKQVGNTLVRDPHLMATS
ncbi:MAG: response regulator [Bacteriovoracaceae bacterium]|nr:response regulator [Bacteriovoracaceae bacterium]